MSKYTNLSDFELLQLLKNDDKIAFDELYKRHWLSLYNIAFRKLKEKEASKDVVHDVFSDLWAKRSERNIDNPLGYLHTAIRYKICTLLSRVYATVHFVKPFENIATSQLTAESDFNEKELRKILDLWMLALPKKRREIFRLNFYEGISTKEISKQLIISQKTVQNQVLTAVNSLRVHVRTYLF